MGGVRAPWILVHIYFGVALILCTQEECYSFWGIFWNAPCILCVMLPCVLNFQSRECPHSMNYTILLCQTGWLSPFAEKPCNECDCWLNGYDFIMTFDFQNLNEPICIKIDTYSTITANSEGFVSKYDVAFFVVSWLDCLVHLCRVSNHCLKIGKMASNEN